MDRETIQYILHGILTIFLLWGVSVLINKLHWWS